MTNSMDNIQLIINNYLRKDSALIIHAGHFLLLYDKKSDTIIPGIYPYMQKAGFTEQLCKEMGLFPILTWEIAVKLLNKFNIPDKRLLIIVNDWQYLKHLKDRRYEFYNQYPSLPPEYNILMQDELLQNSILLTPPPNVNTGIYYSEIYLRNKFQWSIKKMGKTINFENTSFDLKKTGVFCGRPNCAAEVAQLIFEVASAYVHLPVCFVNFYPLSCKNFVEEGTALGLNLFNLRNINILNIGIPNFGINSIKDISGKMICSKFGEMKELV